MKKATITLVLCCFGIVSFAQDDIELTTYFAEKAQFTIDLPDSWSTSVDEKKVMLGYITDILSENPDDPSNLILVKSIAGCRGPANEGKSYKKIFEKEAKKSNDPAFKILGEGLKEDHNGKEYYWLEYDHTFEYSDGRKEVVRMLFIARCHYAGMNKYANVFRFYSTIEGWEKNKELFYKIYETARYTKKQ